MGARLSKATLSCDAAHGSPLPSPEHCTSPGGSQSKVAKLCFAAAAGDVLNVQKLLQGGARADAVDYDHRSALHVAAADGRLEVVGLLLASRASVNAIDRWSRTPLDEARTSCATDVQAALEAAGGKTGAYISSEDPSEATPPQRFDVTGAPLGRQASMEAATTLCCAAAAGALDICQELDNGGIDLNAEDYDGRTALHVAAAHGHLDVVRWLILARADVRRIDAFGGTALTEALRRGHTNLAQALVRAGAEMPEHKDGGSVAGADQPPTPAFDVGVDAWAIPAAEVRFGAELSSTLKSVIYHATWRGSKVVAKTLLSAKTEVSGLKGVATSWADLQDAEAELLHEIRLVATLRHPDLVMFLGACVDRAPPFFISEFMEGGDLERFYAAQMRKSGYPYRPAGAQLMSWASAVARALSFLHGRGRPVIHRDLKPMNLLLTRKLELKVCDFGISKLLAPRAPGTMQQPGQAPAQMSGGVGSWRYMAPEVVRYEQYTDRVDIFSFALILWFMCTGRQPFVAEFGTDAELVLKEYLKGLEPRPSAASMRCPSALRDLTQECWHVSPSSRPQAQECTQRLAEMCAGDDATWRTWSLSGLTSVVRQIS